MALENSQLYVIYRNHTRFLRYPDFCVEVRISTKKLHSTENLISLILDAACPLCQFNNACCTDNVVQVTFICLAARACGRDGPNDEPYLS